MTKREPLRTVDIEEKFERSVEHLAATLAQPPARFHPLNRRQRWRATLQRQIPLCVRLVVIAAMVLLARVPMEDGSALRMLLFQLPPLLLLVFFIGFDALPELEIPRLPRALKQDSWRASNNP